MRVGAFLLWEIQCHPFSVPSRSMSLRARLACRLIRKHVGTAEDRPAENEGLSPNRQCTEEQNQNQKQSLHIHLHTGPSNNVPVLDRIVRVDCEYGKILRCPHWLINRSLGGSAQASLE